MKIEDIDLGNLSEVHLSEETLNSIQFLLSIKSVEEIPILGRIKLITSKLVPNGFIFLIDNKGKMIKIDLRKDEINPSSN